jgi:hypothetical protein
LFVGLFVGLEKSWFDAVRVEKEGRGGGNTAGHGWVSSIDTMRIVAHAYDAHGSVAMRVAGRR